MPAAATARLPFAYNANMSSDGTTTWTVGSGALTVGVTNAYSPINGTHQPYGWDQMAGLYRRYKVVGLSYRITMVTYAASTAMAIVVREVPVNENAAIGATDLATIIERPGARWKVTTAGNGAPPVIENTVDIPALLGVSVDQFDANVEDYSALCTAAPSRYPYIQIGACGTPVSSTCHVVIECVYTVNFWQRITQSQS